MDNSIAKSSGETGFINTRDAQDDDIRLLKKKIEQLDEQNDQLQKRLLDAAVANSNYLQTIQKLKEQVNQLKLPPLFIASVMEVIGDMSLLRQHGSNQEVITRIPPEMADELQAGMRVAVAEEVDHLADLEVQKLGRVEEGAVGRGDAVPLGVEGAELLEVGHVPLVSGSHPERAEVRRELGVDAGILEPGHLVVHAVEPFRVEFREAVARLDAGPSRAVGVLVEAHRVDAVLGVECGAPVGELLVR